MKPVKLAVTTAILASLVSCSPRLFWDKVTDCSSTPECWGGFTRSGTYKTVRPLLYSRAYLADHFYWDGKAPGSGNRVDFDEYRRRPSSFPGVTLIPEGTNIQIRQVQHRSSFEFAHLEMPGVMIDGPRAGAPVDFVDLAFFPVKREIACRKFRVPYFEPNPALIRIQKVEQAGRGDGDKPSN